MRSALAVIVALLSPLLFPGALAYLLIVLAAIIVPPVGVVAGVLTDVLYYVPGAVPYGTIFGLLITGIGFVVHHLIKTRIISA